MKDIEGVVDLHVQLQTMMPFVEVKVDLDAAQRYGLKPGDVLRSPRTRS